MGINVRPLLDFAGDVAESYVIGRLAPPDGYVPAGSVPPGLPVNVITAPEPASYDVLAGLRDALVENIRDVASRATSGIVRDTAEGASEALLQTQAVQRQRTLLAVGGFGVAAVAITALAVALSRG